MPRLDDDHTGNRIREQRKLARLTQRELAARIPYSYSWLTQVECGARPASVDFTAAVARALRIDVTVLTGQPYVTQLQEDRLAELIRPIRESLDLYDLGDDPDVVTRPASDLVTATEELCAHVRATHLHAAAAALPDVIAELTALCWRSPTTEVWQALGSAYRTAHDITVKLGYFDLASVALDRLGWASERASDPCLAAVRQYFRGLVYFREGEYTIGLRLIRSGHGFLDPADESREALTVAGQLHLGGSVLAARADDGSTAASHIEQAREYVDRVGDASTVHWLNFSPANVDLHEMSVAMEMRQYEEAMRQAKAIKLPGSMATSRRAHFFIDRARVEMELGRADASLKSLWAARRAAPEQTRYHPGARETVRGLVHLSRRSPESLGSMAAWVGM
ncbi:helix-turn-helix transcriptional regulator [Streptomyces sp. NBC_00160]|uniref:helix-turn-helix domain-containing protein n=1 Tax=Streptomyces sp. NBC_00160 TaxID=2903628 RepID=UPI0022525D77|nr:helix-turn-helix transcriptional regulator [Streptomyces sp. NBC_00160]MCX5303021.1 helix-turn-helix transcriptional regulator [Streptomyces sp. NBC_00160]